MASTSIHLKPCKQSSELHNKREKPLDYVRTDLSPTNEWWSAVSSLGDLRSQIAALVKEKTGRKMQAKAEPLREGVIVIQPNTTMAQLQELGKRFQERFGVTPVQIAIHRDEGHWKGSEWKPNLHAHIVFDWYNHKTGKSIKTSKQDAAEMQTITAEVLGMERGVSSEKKHLDSARFKAAAQQQEVQDLQEQVENLSNKASQLQKECNTLERLKTEKTAKIESEIASMQKDLTKVKKQLQDSQKHLQESRNALQANKREHSEVLLLLQQNQAALAELNALKHIAGAPAPPLPNLKTATNEEWRAYYQFFSVPEFIDVRDIRYDIDSTTRSPYIYGKLYDKHYSSPLEPLQCRHLRTGIATYQQVFLSKIWRAVRSLCASFLDSIKNVAQNLKQTTPRKNSL